MLRPEFWISSQDLYQDLLISVCEKYSLNLIEVHVILFLANNPGFDTAAQIVAVRHLAKSYVSVAVRALQERGLLRGQRCPDDRRTIHLSLLDAAAPIVADGRAAQERFLSILLHGATQEELDCASSLLEKVEHNIEAYQAPDPDIG